MTHTFVKTGRITRGYKKTSVEYVAEGEPLLKLWVISCPGKKEELRFYVDGEKVWSYGRALKELAGEEDVGRHQFKKVELEYKGKRRDIELKECFVSTVDPRLARVRKTALKSKKVTYTYFVEGRRMRDLFQVKEALAEAPRLTRGELFELRVGMRGRKPRPLGAPRVRKGEWIWPEEGRE